jgi:hypothetical protein
MCNDTTQNNKTIGLHAKNLEERSGYQKNCDETSYKFNHLELRLTATILTATDWFVIPSLAHTCDLYLIDTSHALLLSQLCWFQQMLTLSIHKTNHINAQHRCDHVPSTWFAAMQRPSPRMLKDAQPARTRLALLVRNCLDLGPPIAPHDHTPKHDAVRLTILKIHKTHVPSQYAHLPTAITPYDRTSKDVSVRLALCSILAPFIHAHSNTAVPYHDLTSKHAAVRLTIFRMHDLHHITQHACPQVAPTLHDHTSKHAAVRLAIFRMHDPQHITQHSCPQVAPTLRDHTSKHAPCKASHFQDV